jgi:pimeloyl-ACP methyl ester carboxylesterase
MEPLIGHIQDRVTAWSPDTPGYGMSDPLRGEPQDLEPYVDWLAAFLRQQGLESAGLYGSATGAQIAIQFARRFPEMTDFVVLDNAVHFTDEERQDILRHYFADISPRPDGSHLKTAWDMSTGLFKQFPWYDQREESRIPGAEPPLTLVHATALAYLHSGPDYARAYRAAFINEDARNIQQIKRPTRVIRWAGSILKRYADRLDDYAWPDHIRMVACEASPEARFDAIRQAVLELSG